MLRAGLGAAALLIVACSGQRRTMPLDSPDETAAASHEPSGAAVQEDIPVSTMHEETLPNELPPSAGVPPVSSDGGAELSLLDSIDASTPPNVAAATRLVDAARLHMGEGDSGSALDQLERAIAIDPNNPYAYCYLAQLHLAHRSYDQAIAFADRAATLSGRQAPQWASRALTLRGNALEAIGRYPDARAAYAHAVQITPGNLAAQVGLARLGGTSTSP